ncbi:MAG: hypothetical protein K0Q72_3760, partial [Armatimonadetes bacterium]|nr:hypothetical protein [Armatimonadota bacterium]
ETGMINVVVHRDLHEKNREVYRGHALLVVRGLLDRRERQINVVAEEAWPLQNELPDPVKSAAARRVHQALSGFQTPKPHNFR